MNIANLLVNGYRPTPIEPESNALMRGLEVQRARQGNALQAMQMQAYEQAQQQAAAERAQAAGVQNAYRNALEMPLQQAAAQGITRPTPANAAAFGQLQPRLNQQRLAQELAQVDPMAAAKMLTPAAPDYKVVGDALVRIGPTGVQEAYKGDRAPKLPEGMQMGPSGPMWIPGYLEGKGKVASQGAARTNVNVSTGPKAFWNDVGKLTAETLFKDREGAQAAAQSIQSIGAIRQAAQAGAYQGFGAEVKLGAAKALGALGMPYDEKTVANSEVFDAQAKQFVLASIKALGANPSNTDREFIEKTVPRLGTDPNALPLLLDFMERKARGQLQTFNERARRVQGDPNAEGIPADIAIPEPAAASGGWGIRPIGGK